MLPAQGRRRLGRVLGFAVGVLLVAGQDQPGRVDILTGTDGETSCDLREAILSKCDSVTSFPGLDTTPTPTLCTCNNVYFNIWSACSYASGNNTLPSFQSWAGRCNNNSIDLNASSAKAKGGLAITPPKWAFLSIPGNTSFDIQKAVILAHDCSTQRQWTVFQILAPVISAVVGAISCLVLIYFYKSRRLSRFSIKNKVWSWFRPVHRIKTTIVRDDMDWAIDQTVVATTLAPPVVPPHMVDPQSPLETTRRDTILTIPGNPSNPASAYNEVGREQFGTSNFNYTSVGGAGGTAAFEGGKPPGGRIFVEPTHQPNNSLSTSNGSSSRPSTTIPLPEWVRQIRPPWKNVPVPVRVIRPGKRFEVDAEHHLAAASEDTLPSFTSWGPERPRRSFDDVRVHDADADDFGTVEAETDADDHGSENEGTNLITDEERSVLDIKRNSNSRRGTNRSSSAPSNSVGHDSSINSSVKIVSPSTSSGSPRDSTPGSAGFLSNFRLRGNIHVPPLPTSPAPAPPLSKQSAKPRTSVLGIYSSTPTTTNPLGRVMSPIQEHPAFEPASEERSWAPGPSKLHISTVPTHSESVRPAHAPSFSPPPLPTPPANTTGAHTPRRPSFDSRPLPSPSIAAAGSSSNHLTPPHVRSLSQSHTPTSSSVYEESSSAHGGSTDYFSRIDHSRSRSGSSDSVPAVGSPLRPGQRSLTRPLPTPTTPSTPNNSNAVQGRPSVNGNGMKTQASANYLHYDTHQRSASGSSVSLATSHYTVFTDPWATMAGGSSRAGGSVMGDSVPAGVGGGGGGHGRGLSFDDGASFYLTAHDGPVMPLRRSPSPQEEQGDPRMLFPLSVRGAGYRGTPDSTTK